MDKIVILFLCLILSSVAESDVPTTKNKPNNFDSYVNGALDVYSQFKTPSKEESEKFYLFLNAKWTLTDCQSDCQMAGYKAAREYVNMKNIKIQGN